MVFFGHEWLECLELMPHFILGNISTYFKTISAYSSHENLIPLHVKKRPKYINQ